MPIAPDTFFRLVETTEDCADLKRWMGERRDVLAIDTETTGLEWWGADHRLRMVVIGDTRGAFVVPWERWAGVVYETLPAYEGETVFHHAKFDFHFLERAGCAPRRDRAHDTKVMAHLLDPVGTSSLKPLSVRYVDPAAASGQEALKDAMKAHGWTWATIPFDFPAYWQYAALDGVITAHLHDVLRAQVETSYHDVYDLEMAVQWVLLDMERRGARIDVAYASKKEAELLGYTARARDWVQETYGVSATSNRQIAQALQDDGVRLTALTPTGEWKMDEDVLSGIDHPLAKTVLQIRQAQKYAKTYFRSTLDRLDGDVVHCSINALGARTGRMSISEPPLQQLPRGPLVRDSFIPRDGNAFVLIDFDQVEMRLLAHFANEEGMIEAIRSGVDLHGYTASILFGPNYTKEQRQRTKIANFGTIYGVGKESFARQLGTTVDEAAAFLRQYKMTFSGVDRFTRQVEQVARQRYHSDGEAWIRTPVGRRHPLDMQSLYKGVNYLIQGTAADVLKQKIVSLDMAGFGEYLILPVHDEVIFDVPAELAEDVAREAQAVMQETYQFVVPLTAGAEIASARWGDKYREAA